MEITQILPKDSYLINGYGEGKIIVNQITWTKSLIVSNHWIDEYDGAKTILEEENFKQLIKEIKQKFPKEKNIYLVIGTGKEMIMLPEKLQYIGRDIGIIGQTMPTFAACRTYNALICENRLAVATLEL